MGLTMGGDAGGVGRDAGAMAATVRFAIFCDQILFCQI